MTFLKHKVIGAVALASFLMLTSATALISCSHKEEKPGVAARVGNKELTDAEVVAALPLGLSEADSIAFASDFIDHWIINELIGEIAAKNINNLEEIEKLTQEYRRSLIIDEYRRQKAAQDTSLSVTKQQIEDFYANHGGEMRLKEPMIRGIFIAISTASPQLPAVRRLYHSAKSDDIDKLDKIGLTEAVNYEYFRDRWLPLSAITGRFPGGKPGVTHKGQNIEVNEEGNTYFLSISDFLPAGASMPLSAAEPEIRERLEAARQMEIDARLKHQLYEKAIKKGTAWKR